MSDHPCKKLRNMIEYFGVYSALIDTGANSPEKSAQIIFEDIIRETAEN